MFVSVPNQANNPPVVKCVSVIDINVTGIVLLQIW